MDGTLAILAIFIGISQSAGIGGGPIINILLIIGLGYTSKQSINTAYILLMGGSLASVILQYKKCEGNKNSLFDLDLILMTLPMMMSGSIFGLILSDYMSELSKTILFSILVLFLAYQSCAKYFKARLNSDQPNRLIMPYYSPNNTDQEEQQNTLETEKMMVGCLVIIYNVVILMFRGGKRFESVLEFAPCGLWYWVCNIIHFSLSLVTVAYIITINWHSKNQKYTISKTIKFVIYGFLAGIAGGAVGLGGATILVPAWLHQGLHQQVVVANSSPLIFLSSLSLFFISAMSGSYQIQLVIKYLILSFVSSIVVRIAIEWVVKKWKQYSLIYLILFATMMLSLILFVPYQYSAYLREPEEFVVFGQFC